MDKQERLAYMKKRFTALKDRLDYDHKIGGMLPATHDDVIEELGVMDTVRTFKKENSNIVLTSDEIPIS